MSVVTLLPLVVLAVAAVAIGLAVARALEEVALLRAELEQSRRLRPLVAEVGTEALRLRLTLARLRRR